MQEFNSVENILDTEIPIWDKPELPEYAQVIMLAQQFVEKYGCNMLAWYRLPLGRLQSTGIINPLATSVNGNGFNQTIPKNRVIPAYVNTSNPYDIRRASSASPTTFSKFLVLGSDINNSGFYLVQSTGPYTFLEGHSYIVGQTYYLGEDGLPTTAKPIDASKVQELFYVLSNKVIDIKVG